jgi:NAD+ kinase
VRPSDVENAFERLLNDEFEVEERMMLEARVLRSQSNISATKATAAAQVLRAGTGTFFLDSGSTSQPPGITLKNSNLALQSLDGLVDVGGSIGLNDAVVAKSALARILRFHIYVSGDLVAETRADGLVISTPTGSTAYALSAGGPIVHPNVPLLLLCPICSHSIAQRPFIVGPDETIELHAEWEGDEVAPGALEAMLTIDGQVGVVLQSGDRVVVQRSALKARLLQDPNDSFFSRLREKLHWI